MYQVIKMYGDFEPWWLLEGWQEDVIDCQSFDTYQEAMFFYEKQRQELSQKLSQSEEKHGRMAAFWDSEDQRWCEECDEYLQQFYSLMILSRTDKNGQTAQPISKRFHIRSPKQCKLIPKSK